MTEEVLTTVPPVSPGAVVPPARQQLIGWAARLVNAVCGAELAQDVDRDVAEPVRAIAMEMKRVADAMLPSSSPMTPAEIAADWKLRGL